MARGCRAGPFCALRSPSPPPRELACFRPAPRPRQCSLRPRPGRLPRRSRAATSRNPSRGIRIDRTVAGDVLIAFTSCRRAPAKSSPARSARMAGRGTSSRRETASGLERALSEAASCEGRHSKTRPPEAGLSRPVTQAALVADKPAINDCVHRRASVTLVPSAAGACLLPGCRQCLIAIPRHT